MKFNSKSASQFKLKVGITYCGRHPRFDQFLGYYTVYLVCFWSVWGTLSNCDLLNGARRGPPRRKVDKATRHLSRTYQDTLTVAGGAERVARRALAKDMGVSGL